MSDHKTRRGALIQGIYGLFIGFLCVAAIPLGLPLSWIAMVPATLALGFGFSHIRDAIIWDQTHSE